MEFILELIPPRLFAFIIAVPFIIGGVYAWQEGGRQPDPAYALRRLRHPFGAHNL